MFILQCLIVKKTTTKLSKIKSRNRRRSKRYIVSFLSSLESGTSKTISWSKYKNLLQHAMKEQRSAYKSYIEKMILNLLLNYPDQNISNQFTSKKLLSYIKSLRTDKTDVTPMRRDGQITADTKQKSDISNKQCQSVFTVESQNNIPDCTKTHTPNISTRCKETHT